MKILIALLAFLFLLTGAASRDPAQVRAFRKNHPCPATGKADGPCIGFVVNHVVPLCWGGKDAPLNMEWQDVTKSYLRDKFEREACAMKRKVEKK